MTTWTQYKTFTPEQRLAFAAANPVSDPNALLQGEDGNGGWSKDDNGNYVAAAGDAGNIVYDPTTSALAKDNTFAQQADGSYGWNTSDANQQYLTHGGQQYMPISTATHLYSDAPVLYDPKFGWIAPVADTIDQSAASQRLINTAIMATVSYFLGQGFAVGGADLLGAAGSGASTLGGAASDGSFLGNVGSAAGHLAVSGALNGGKISTGSVLGAGLNATGVTDGVKGLLPSGSGSTPVATMAAEAPAPTQTQAQASPVTTGVSGGGVAAAGLNQNDDGESLHGLNKSSGSAWGGSPDASGMDQL